MDDQNENQTALGRSGENLDRPIPVAIEDGPNDDFETQIRRLEAELAADKARRAHELDSTWAIDQQRTSIILFRTFAVLLIVIFMAALLVLLFSCDERQVHLATVLIEIVMASVIAGYLGYMLAKPFEHRR